MLIKLMKHELKATARLLVPLYLILLCTTLINRIVLRLDIYDGILNIIPGFLIFAYILLIVTILIVTVFLMIIRFYKNLLTDEGYLMFTLPAKTHQLINSKLLITVFWTIVSIVAILSSLYIVFATPERMNMVMAVIKEALAEIKSIDENWFFLLTEVTIMCLVGLIANILLIYVSIAVGQLMNKQKLIGSFLAYVAISTAVQFIMVIVLVIIGISNFDNSATISTLPTIFLPVCIVITMIGSVGFYAATNYIFKRKLNLE